MHSTDIGIVRSLIPDAGFQGLTEHQLEALATGAGLEITLAAEGVFLAEEVLAKDEPERSAGCCGFRLAVKVLGQPALQVGGATNIEVTVMHGEQDIDAVL